MIKRGSYAAGFFHVILLLCTIALLFGCGSSESVDLSGLIGPEGGTVTSSDGKASVSIPAGALAKKTSIVIRPVSDVPAGKIGPAYEFLPGDINFLIPVTVSISYNKAAIPSGLNESDLCLGIVVKATWDLIMPSFVDTDNHIVSSDVDRFSRLSLISTASIPTGVMAFPETPRRLNSKITIRWNPVMGATSYKIFWSNTPGVSNASGNMISNVSSPYTHKDLINGTTYYYIVTAVNSFGEIVQSLETAATPGMDYISGGRDHVVVLKSDGTVWTWGDNSFGQLGDGTKIGRSTPAQVQDLTDVIAVAAGRTVTMALKSDGTVWTWGINSSGELGDGTYVDRAFPGQVTELTDIVTIAADWSTCIALRNDGTVWTWGDNTKFGMIGDGDGTTANRSLPVQVIGLNNIVAVSAKRAHALALKSDGTIWAWGNNQHGQLGNGTDTGESQIPIPTPTPVQVSGFTDPHATISAGYWHSMAMKDDGTVWTWGHNDVGELCDGTEINRSLPGKAEGITDVLSLKGGEDYTMFLKRDGTLWMCGNNSIGQLGIEEPKAVITRPVQVTGLSDVIGITSGRYFQIALKQDGTLWTWGFNDKKQLWDGITTLQTAPVQVPMDPLF